VPQRRERTKIAVALHVHGQQNDRHTLKTVIPSEARNLSGSFSPLVYPACPELRGATRHSFILSRVEGPLNIERYADNWLDVFVLGSFVKRHHRMHTVGVRERNGRHVLLDRSSDDFFRRSDASQERIVTVTM